MGGVIYVTGIHLSGGTNHHHIDSVKWLDDTDGKAGTSTRTR
jgi:hypothetical protein